MTLVKEIKKFASIASEFIETKTYENDEYIFNFQISFVDVNQIIDSKKSKTVCRFLLNDELKNVLTNRENQNLFLTYVHFNLRNSNVDTDNLIDEVDFAKGFAYEDKLIIEESLKNLSSNNNEEFSQPSFKI